MAASITLSTSRAADPRAWPPSAEPQRVELPLLAVLGILVAIFVVQIAVFVGAAGGTSLAPFGAFGAVTEANVRLFVIPSVVGLALAVGTVLVLEWQGPAGLGRGTTTPWGVVPLVLFLLTAVVTLTLPGATSDPSIVVTIAFGFLLAAAFEEILFRGFLLHGLARRMNGDVAVFVSSALFSTAHLPGYLVARATGGFIVVSLVALFGVGIVLCRIRVDTRTVWWATAVHALWNFVTIGSVAWAPSPDSAVIPAVGALKLAGIVAGLVLAIRFGVRARRARHLPPMPGGGFDPALSIAAAPASLPPPPVP